MTLYILSLIFCILMAAVLDKFVAKINGNEYEFGPALRVGYVIVGFIPVLNVTLMTLTILFFLSSLVVDNIKFTITND